MGLSLRNLAKKVTDVIGGVERQINPFDNNKTYSNTQGGGADFATRYSPQHVAAAVGEGIQKTFTPLYQPIVRTIPELGGSIASPFKPDSRTPHGVLEEALFGKEPIQNIQAKVATNYKDHPNLPTPLRVALAGGEGLASLASDVPIPTSLGIKKGAQLAAQELKPTVRLLKEAQLNEIGAVGKNVGTPDSFVKPKKGSNVVMMTPDDYIKQAFKSQPNYNPEAHPDAIKRAAEYAKAMKNGDKFPLPSLGENSQDGFHRVFAAKMNGVKEVPVEIRGPKIVLPQLPKTPSPTKQTSKVALPEKPNVAQSPVTPVRGPDVAPVKVGLKTEFQKKFVDRDAVLLNQMRAIDKANPVPKGKISRQQEFMYNSNMTRGSNAIANHILEKSDTFKGAIGGLNKQGYKAFSEYANARRELSEVDRAEATSKPIEQLRAIVDAGDNNPDFVQRFDNLNQHYKNLAEVAHKAGIIDSETLANYNKNNNYVRLQRDMGDLLPTSYGKGASYNLGSTTITKKFRGSKRQALTAGETAADYTQQVYREAAKNQTGLNLMDNLHAHGLAEKLDNAAAARHENVVRVFRDGKQEYYRVSPDIKEAVNNINPYTMNVVMQILAAPGRVFRAGVTGLNPVFIARNLLKDQAGTAINSEHLMSTHSGKNFVKGLYGASKGVLGVNHDALWAEFEKHYGDQTSYDLTRNAKNTKQLVNAVRGGKTVKLGQKLKSPIRSLEDIASVTEKSTRFQNFRGEYEKAIKQNVPHEEAIERAAIAAWQNSVDFSRAGSWGRVLNTVFPYWNPSTQGVRQMTRTVTNHPIKSVFTGTAILGVPIAAATAYNLSSDKTKKIYDQITENDKDNNIVIINPDGKGGYIKVPLPPGYKDAFMPFRRAMEAFHHDQPAKANQIAQDILQTVSGPIQIQTLDQVKGSIIPQAIKPEWQQAANKDYFTSKQIVPDYINQATDAEGKPVPESLKAYQSTPAKDGKPAKPGTSGTARIIGGKTNTSPIRIEKLVKDVGGAVGQNVLNKADQILSGQGLINGRGPLAGKGIIPKEQVGGLSVSGGFKRSFTGNIAEFDKSEGAKYFAKVSDFSKTLTPTEKSIYDKIAPNKKNFLGDKIFTSYPLTKSSDYADLIANSAFLDKYQNFNKSQKDHDPLWDLNSKQLRAYMNAQVISKFDPGGDSTTVRKLYDNLPDDFFTKRTAYFDSLKAKGVKLDDSQVSLRPGMPKDLQDFADSYGKLPYGTGARSSALRSSKGQAYIAWLDQNRIYNNQQRADLGLPPLEDTSNKYGSSGGSSNTFASTYAHTVSRGVGKISAPKVSIKKGSSAKVARSNPSKAKVSIKKSLV